MTLTRPGTEQIIFHSDANGDQILDDYLNAAEIAGKTLAQILDGLVDSSGNPDFVELRVDSGNLEVRYGAGAWEFLYDLDAGTQLSKDWAVKIGSTVDGVDFSAKHHALAASTSASNAATSASNAATSATNAATSASAAASSASAAAISASNALNSELAAEAARDDTIAALDNALVVGPLILT